MKKLIVFVFTILLCGVVDAQDADFLDFIEQYNWNNTKNSVLKKYANNLAFGYDANAEDSKYEVSLRGITLGNTRVIVTIGFDSVSYRNIGVIAKADTSVVGYSSSRAEREMKTYLQRKLGEPLFSMSKNTFENMLGSELMEELGFEYDLENVDFWTKDDIMVCFVVGDDGGKRIFGIMARTLNMQEDNNPKVEITGHLKFMGIPLDGNINDFTTKMKEKGFSIAAENTYASPGVRLFDGMFTSEKAKIVVYYNPFSKNVNSAKAVMTFKGLSNAQGHLNYIEGMLDKKYQNSFKRSLEIEDHGHPLTAVQYVLFSVEENYSGTISLYIKTDSYSETGEFRLHVEYEDELNSEENEKLDMEDL